MFDMFFSDGSLYVWATGPSCKNQGVSCQGGFGAKEVRENRYANYCKSAAGAGSDGCFGKILNDNWEMKY